MSWCTLQGTEARTLHVRSRSLRAPHWRPVKWAWLTSKVTGGLGALQAITWSGLWVSAHIPKAELVWPPSSGEWKQPGWISAGSSSSLSPTRAETCVKTEGDDFIDPLSSDGSEFCSPCIPLLCINTVKKPTTHVYSIREVRGQRCLRFRRCIGFRIMWKAVKQQHQRCKTAKTRLKSSTTSIYTQLSVY